MAMASTEVMFGTKRMVRQNVAAFRFGLRKMAAKPIDMIMAGMVEKNQMLKVFPTAIQN